MRQPYFRIFSEEEAVDLAPPRLKLESDRQVYRPGDPITITIEIKNNNINNNNCSLLIENLSFECKGIEKLDTKWFNSTTATHDSQHRRRRSRGEYVFMDCSTSTIVSNRTLSHGATKTYVVRTILPDPIPPSYKGTTIRYIYYCRTTLSAHFQILENGEESIQEFPQLEARLPLQIWVTQKNNGRIGEEGCIDGQGGIIPLSTILLDVYWKEMDADSEWVKVNESFDEIEEGYGSSRDEILSVSSYKAMKEDVTKPFGSSLSLQLLKTLFSTRGNPYVEVRRSISPNMALPRLSVAEVIHDSTFGQLPKHTNGLSMEDESRIPSASGSTESGASEGIVSGRSYNIKMDGEVLLRFSPKNSESTYYFNDLIGGTLTFFHDEGVKRCLELSITLETKETINRCFVQPSTKHSSITKIHSDHYEVVADLVQTSFLFSIPADGPMTFSTPYVSVEWALRFEFLVTPKDVELRRFEHPLLIEGRDKCEWVFPITVHAPSLGNVARNEKLLFSGSVWDSS